MPPSSKFFAVIAGVGPGTGACISRRFAQHYPVALLGRNPDNFSPLVDEINKSGGKAIGISTDVSDAASVKAAFAKIERDLGGEGCAAAVFNAGGKFVRKSILELTEEEFMTTYDVSCKGAFHFTQSAMPHLLRATSTSEHPPTLIYTGATASIKSNALVSSFSSAKHAMRALAQSVAREFAPKGVHVSHAIIDGMIDIPRSKDLLKDVPAEGKINPDAIADTYWNLHTQSKSAFTFEVDIRPMLEKW